MAWSEQLFRYCERGADAAFWAEPLNALSNIAFLVAALAAGRELAGRPTGGRRHFEALLVVLVAVIGIGSFLFHTLATRWAMYRRRDPDRPLHARLLGLHAARLPALPWLLVAIGVAGFVWRCRSPDRSRAGRGSSPDRPRSGRASTAPSATRRPSWPLVGIGALLLLERHRPGGTWRARGRCSSCR